MNDNNSHSTGQFDYEGSRMLGVPIVMSARSKQIRIASNPWLENATLNAVMEQMGFLKSFDVDTMVIHAAGVAGPFDAIAAGKADICMVSGYNRVLPRIASGEKIKIVGAGMRKPPLAIFARSHEFGTLADMKGQRFAVGPTHGLLHMLMQRMLKENGFDTTHLKFVNFGSNSQCYHAVVAGEADACCTSISHLNNQDNLSIIEHGNIWETLPRYTFQTAYASDVAIKTKRDGLVAVMAAYGALYNYLMTAKSHDGYIAARRLVPFEYDERLAQTNWDFIQTQRPYCADLSLTTADVDYLQEYWVKHGIIDHQCPATSLADQSLSREAASLLAKASII